MDATTATSPPDADRIQDPVGEEQDPAVEEQVAPSSGAAVAHASQHENPTDQAEALGTGLGDRATGDIVIDSALQDLQNAPADDLDAQIDAGQRVQQTLQARLSDLGGE
jgi:DNA polymerase-3 subunit gamma/tau